MKNITHGFHLSLVKYQTETSSINMQMNCKAFLPHNYETFGTLDRNRQK